MALLYPSGPTWEELAEMKEQGGSHISRAGLRMMKELTGNREAPLYRGLK